MKIGSYKTKEKKRHKVTLMVNPETQELVSMKIEHDKNGKKKIVPKNK